MKKLMLGDFAVARGAYEAGVKTAFAYPGTPSTEIAEEIAKYDEVYAEWAPNEKVALEAGIGASMLGARTIVSMKHVGLNVSADPLYTVAYMGVNGGLVIAVADDPGMHSSQNEQDTRLIARASNTPVLEPSDSEESRTFTKLAFDISEKFDTPVILRMTTRVAHSQSLVNLEDREERALIPYEKNPQKNVMMPAFAKLRHIVVEKRLNTIKEYAETLEINRVEYNDKKIGIVCAGGVYEYVKEAMPNVSVFKLGMVFPLPVNALKEFAKNVERCIVVEELEPFIENNMKKEGIKVEGKELFTIQGEYSTNYLREKLLGETIKKSEFTLPNRPPVMCAGCPHRGTFYVLKKMNLKVFADIGCYTLGATPPLNAVDTVVCMGASIGMLHGAIKADSEAYKNSVAVIGDSTFIHSGITGLIDSVYNKGKGTIIIVDNRTTGMTGHQDHPGTGKTLKKEDTYAISLEEVVKAVGVKNLQVCDPNNMAELERILKEELAKEEVSVVIVRRPCVLLTKKNYKGFEINQDKCKKCQMCLKIGCPAISNNNGKIEINKALCTECGLCLQLCKFKSIDGGKN